MTLGFTARDWGDEMMRALLIGSLTLLCATVLPAQTGAPPAATGNSPAGKLDDKLINQPASATWNVYGAAQTNQVIPNGAPQNYPATRVTVATKGANPWDAGAGSAIVKPVAAGDVILVAVYLRAPALKDGETTPVSYLGVNESGPPYDSVAQASANVGNQWKMYFASGTAKKAYGASAITVGIHLATDKHVLDLGPLKVFDLGPNVDLSRLPKNG